MDVEMVQSNEECVLRLKGSWTIERAHELKQALIETLQGCDRIVIDSAALTDADLSCLQLLCAAHRTSLKFDKQLTLGEEKSEAFERVVRDAGFVRTLGCHKDPHKSCLWVGGWKA